MRLGAGGGNGPRRRRGQWAPGSIGAQGCDGASAKRGRVLGARSDRNRGGRRVAGDGTPMSEREAFDAILASLHETALDRAHWSSATALIDDALGTHGSSMVFGDGDSEKDIRIGGGVAGGRLDIQPAFVLDAPPTLPERAGPYRLVGSDAQDGELFALRFDMQEVADPETEGDAGFTFAIPVQAGWAEAMATITLTGPEGSATLARDDPASAAAALVLDEATGRIQAILHASPEQTVAADQRMFTSPGTVTLFSRGIPGPEAWRR